MKKITPYQNDASSKATQVRKMFDGISKRYDLLNRLLSGGLDILWRKAAIAEAGLISGKRVLDIATGTCDLALEAERHNPAVIVGIDLSYKMLLRGKWKVYDVHRSEKVVLAQADALAMPFADGTFDVAICAFGVRNFENLQDGLREIYRVLAPGGTIVILEFSLPAGVLFGEVFKFYFRHVLSRIGGVLSGDSSAYVYLPESVGAFPSGSRFTAILESSGFVEPKVKRLLPDVASVYTATKDFTMAIQNKSFTGRRS